jgi:DNA-directed RNA polymerase specialized sigma24 family protein
MPRLRGVQYNHGSLRISNHLLQREREVIGLKFVAGLHNREIARVLSVPEGTVSSLLYRALRRLCASLGEDESGEGGERYCFYAL